MRHDCVIMTLLQRVWDFPIVKCLTMPFLLIVNMFSGPLACDELTALGYKESSQFGVFYSLQTILNTLDNKKYQSKPKVHQLLHVFETHCRPRKKQPLSPHRPYPFIVIEGAQRTGRRIVGKELARSLGAKVVDGVPRCLLKLRHQFERESDLKRTFFALANYITAFNVRHLLEDMPVVVLGYWMDQAVFNIAKEFPNTIPPPTSLIYKFPADLLAPDIVFYYNNPRAEVQGDYQDNDFNNKMLEVYRRLREPNVTVVNTKVVTEGFINDLRAVIKRELQHKYPHLLL